MLFQNGLWHLGLPEGGLQPRTATSNSLRRTAAAWAAAVATSVVTLGAAAEDCDVADGLRNRQSVGLYLTSVRAADETEHDGWGEFVANDALRLVGAASTRAGSATSTCGIFRHLGDNYQDGTDVRLNEPLAFIPLEYVPNKSIVSLVLVEEDWSGTDYAKLKNDVHSVTTGSWDHAGTVAVAAQIGIGVGAVFWSNGAGPIIFGAVGALVGGVIDGIAGAVVSAESDIFTPAVLTLGVPSAAQLQAALPGGRSRFEVTFKGHGGEYVLTFEWRMPTQAIFAGDFNADEKSDLAVWDDEGKSWEINRSSGDGFRTETWTGAWASDGPVRVGDFNGDGRSDIIMWRDVRKDWTVNLSAGSRFDYRVWTGAWGSDGPIQVGDFNGDGKSDVIMWRDSRKDWTVNLSTGTGFDFRVWTGAWGSDGPMHIGDFNGDGKSDVIMWRESNNDWTVNLSTGTGFDFRVWSGRRGSDGPIQVGDFNADGKTDVMMWRDSTKDWTVNLSTGTGFDTGVWTGAWGSDGPIRVGDFNGDGKSDIIMWRDSTKSWTVNLSTGTGFDFRVWSGAWGSDGEARSGDFNGDGRTDIIMWRDVESDWTVNLSTGSNFDFHVW